jgi:HlyD family secretion protein
MNAPLRSPKPIDPALAEHLPDALALEHRPLPRLARITGYLLMGMIVSFLVWASIAKVDRIVVAPGKLVSSEPLIVVQPLESAIVRDILVKAGDTVRKGEVVAHLDPTFVTAEATSLTTQKASLDAEIDRLLAGLSGSPYAAGDDAERRRQASLLAEHRAEIAASLDALDAQISKDEAALATNAGRQAAVESRIVLLKSIEDIRAKLFEKNYVSRVEMLEAQAATLAATAELDQLKGEAVEQQHGLASDEARRAAFDREWRRKVEQELVDATRRRDAVAEELTKASRKAELSALVAPADGVVMEIAHRSIGSVLQPAEPLVTIVPAGAPLKAEVEIDAADIGSVTTGSTVRVKVEAFPFQRYGTLDGTLEVVSPDAFRREAPAIGAYFRGLVGFESLALSGLGDAVRLTPGMTVTAEIHAGEQRLIAYISYPVIRVLDEGLREPR